MQAQVHTWTSAADANRTFEATYVKCEDNVVTVKLKSGTPLSFPLTTVSAADRKYVRTRLGIKPTVIAKVPKVNLDIPALFDGKLVTVDGAGKVAPFSYAKGKTPALFLIYVSAYW
ncbi:MAG: hypothetical protein ACI9R3_004108 [Verrucomicrobiales bacterium]|jgi:hypothetical protein